MFLGVVPADCIAQMLKVLDLEAEHDVHVCCSGTFRFERALTAKAPHVAIHSNDVSLFSCAIGGLARGKPVDFRFTGELASLEDIFGGAEPIRRVAAMMVAFEMARFARRNNEFNRRHFAYYAENTAAFTDRTVPKVQKALDDMRVASFFAGDWLAHARAAIERDALIVAFPPFAKGGYEAQFKFLHQNVAWTEPPYEMWDPKNLEAKTVKLEAEGARFCMLTDQRWADCEPVLKFARPGSLPHYCYADTPRSSNIVRCKTTRPFWYRPIDPSKLSAETKIEVVAADSGMMNHIKDVYLAKGIFHGNGMRNYLVLLDGMLAGGIIYEQVDLKLRAHYGSRTLRVLSDFSLTREGRVSKLIAMLSRSFVMIAEVERATLNRYQRLVTQVLSKNPASMKYRGVFDLLTRRQEGGKYVLIYEAAPVADEPNEIYRQWWNQHGRKAVARNPAPAPGAPPAPGGQREVHDREPAGPADRKHQARRRADKRAPGVADAGSGRDADQEPARV